MLRSASPRVAVDVLREGSSGLLFLAVLVGAGAGLGAIVFRWLIKLFTRALSGHDDYSSVGHAINPHVPWLGPWFVVLAPVVAGLVYGPMVHLFAREARGHGVPEVMFAVARRGGRIAPQVAGVKALASALCIGGGGSVGREGPIVQIGSALGSTLGRVVKVAESRMRVLVACGAAAGIAATFNAPLAGVFFSMELILSDFAAEAFGMVVLASVTASVIGRAALGNEAFLNLPEFTVDNVGQYLLFALLGVLAGAVGVGFTKVLYLIEDACDAIWRGPEWLRPAVGGVVLGGLLLVLPQMYGVGYPVLDKGVSGAYAVGFLLVLLAGKAVATSLTIGIGGSGGVFAPSLFIGAMLGAAYGQTLQAVGPAWVGAAGAYGLIGMGAVFAGAARAPITAVIIMFELTGEYSIILPLMGAIVLATGMSNLLTGDTIYTLKLRRRGVDLSSPAQQTPRAVHTTVGQLMGPVPAWLTADMNLSEAAEILVRSGEPCLPVHDGSGAYRGVLAGRTAVEALADDRHDEVPVAEMLERPAAVVAAATLDQALDSLDHSTGAVPVLDAEHRDVIGWLTTGAALRAMRGAPPVAGGSGGPAPAEPSPPA